MKLYTRLIEEGIFIFWNSDEGNTSYNLKIRIAVGDDKVELANFDMPRGQNYYSFDKVGSGDYEIELNGYKENCIYQTETKKIKIVSSVQKEQEQTDKIMTAISEMDELLFSIKSKLSFIEIHTSNISSLTALTDPEKAYEFITEVYDWYNRRGGWRRYGI